MSEPESFRRRRRRSVGCGHIAAFLLTKGAMLKSTPLSKTAKRGTAQGTARREKDQVALEKRRQARDEMKWIVLTLSIYGESPITVQRNRLTNSCTLYTHTFCCFVAYLSINFVRATRSS